MTGRTRLGVPRCLTGPKIRQPVYVLGCVHVDLLNSDQTTPGMNHDPHVGDL